MNRTEFNLMFWGTLFAYAVARNLVYDETVMLMSNLAVAVFWGYCFYERAKTIGWSGAWWLASLIPLVNLLMALVLGIYQPRNNVTSEVRYD